MLKDVHWAEDGTYRPGAIFSPERFFNDGFKNSCYFDLQLGYFSSATISVLAESFATFISNGGRMRLVINHIVSEEDKAAISHGLLGDVFNCYDLSNFEELRKTFDEYQEQFFECLAYMIANKTIDIRIIKPVTKHGIAHTKSGQFRDGMSITSFTGSANFTIAGLFNNLEEIKIDRSDSPDEMTQNRIISQGDEFDSIMAGTKRDIEYLSPEQLISAVSSVYKDQDIDELIDAEKQLRYLKISRKKAIEHSSLQDFNSSDYSTKPEFPYESGPREYQKIAFDNWEANQYKGFFAMATGTGKTITSLNCLLNLYKAEGCYKAIILVPTIALVNQWQKECMKFSFTKTYKVSSKEDWKNGITALISSSYFHDRDLSYVVIATYASFAKNNIFARLIELPESTLLIADEAHNMGSSSLMKIMPQIPFERRIGFSATPNRQFDDIGNSAIRTFFNCQHGYTFEYSMQEAINNGVLCKYRYFPHLVELTQEEFEQYEELSSKIAKFYNPDSDKFKDDPILTALLLKRKRIIHKAANKLIEFKRIILSELEERGTLKYTLVYSPEGVKPTDTEFYSVVDCDDDEEYNEEKSGTPLIDLYTSIVASADKYVTVEKFTSMDKGRARMLKDFAEGRTHVLVSMKCLDEGVDIPRAELAIFCASTGNPRQFIQRRGRILRTHKNKSYAYIHDLVIAPHINKNSDSFLMERSLLLRELKRVRDFALLSTNISYTENALAELIDYYNLNLYTDEQD